MLKQAGLSRLRHFAGIRTYALLAIAFYVVLFNLERIGLQGISSVSISISTYILLIFMAIVLLASPNINNQRFAALLGVVATVYIFVEIVPAAQFSPLTYALNLGALAITLGLVRALSQSVLSYEEDVQRLVMDPDNVQVLPYYIGERRANQEIFRLARDNRPLSIVYCCAFEDEDEDAPQYEFMEINEETIKRHIDELSKKRRNQVRLARAVTSLAYKSDIIVQQADGLIVCLCEAAEEDAQRFVERLSFFLASDSTLRMWTGIATFPDNGKTFDELVHVARGNISVLEAPSKDATLPRRTGEVLVDLDRRLEIEQKSAWVNKLAYQSPSAKAIYHPLKRLMDIELCLAVMPLVLPLCLIIALAIYLDDRGPIFYMQDRTGFGGKRFRMYKFRTMIVNAPALQPNKIIGPDGKEIYAWPDKDEDDPRITKIGRFLRKTSLDEIPQIINVLLGHMSVVGPRPTTWDVSMYTLHQTERLTVAPGITGLWQVSARESKNPDERLLWDLKYVEKMSFWLDIQILWRTALQVIKKGGV